MATTTEQVKGTIAEESIYLFKARIEGLSPILMAHPRGMEPEEDPKAKGPQPRNAAKQTLTPDEEAETRVYRDPVGNLYVPVLAIARVLVTAGGLFQDPNYKRGTLAKGMAAGVYMPDYEGFTITRNGEPVSEYETDTRRAVNKTTKGAILVSRPKVILPWEVSIECEVDSAFFSPDVVASVLNTAGRKLGILAFRPEKLGPFGRFRVADFGTEGLDG